MNQYRAICARIKGNDLVSVECRRLTGGIPDEDGVAVCARVDAVPRSAYLRLGLRWMAQGHNLEELVVNVQSLRLCCNDFRIEFLNLSGRLTAPKNRAILNIADSINGYPNLDAPVTRYMIVAQKDGTWLGEVLAESSADYRKHDDKPHHATISLPARLSRSLVNLVAPGTCSLLDPFCGTGSILLEANAIGLEAFGADFNPHMAGITLLNLRHFGYPAQVKYIDVLNCHQKADAIVTDLPYGRVLQGMDDRQLLAIFQHCAGLASQGIFLAGQDISALMVEAGYADVHVYCVRKRIGMERFVHTGVSGGSQ